MTILPNVDTALVQLREDVAALKAAAADQNLDGPVLHLVATATTVVARLEALDAHFVAGGPPPEAWVAADTPQYR